MHGLNHVTESILLEPQSKGKRKFKGEQDPEKRQKSFHESQLEWIIRNAVERAVQPLKEKLTQIKRILQEREQEGRRQEGKKQEGKRQEEEGKGERVPKEKE